MKRVKPLPQNLVAAYHNWVGQSLPDKRETLEHLADEGQSPQAMVISCADSRVLATQVFGADVGDFFMHRNVANLVPPYAPDGAYHGTSAAVEFAVTTLKVSSLIVMGHSMCGGIKGCHAMCSGQAPELERPGSFVGRWMDIMRPGYERVVARETDPEAQVSALEREGVLVSLENLMTFPFVEERVNKGTLMLHGLWIDIRTGRVEGYDPESGGFEPI